ncbi:MAG: hypothetical protein RL148_1535 [Planctomycetota bacterium]
MAHPNLDTRKRTNLWAALTSDPLRKLAAVLLAVALWFYLDSQVRTSHDFTLPVEVVDVEELRTLPPATGKGRIVVLLPLKSVACRRVANAGNNEPLDAITVTVKGKRHQVQELVRRPLSLQVGPFPESDWRTATGREFSAEELGGDPLFEELDRSMAPGRVRLELEPTDARTMAMSTDLVELQPSEQAQRTDVLKRLRTDNAKFNPDSVRLSGPRSSLEAFPGQGRKPFRAVLDPAPGSRQVTLKLALNSQDPALKLDNQPSLTIDIAPDLREYSLELPVRVDSLSLPKGLGFHYEPRTETMPVRIRAGGQLQSTLEGLDDQQRSTWARQHLRLSVWIAPREDQAYGNEILESARLELLGPLSATLDRSNYSLAESVLVALEKKIP